jgi:hypothetical protein
MTNYVQRIVKFNSIFLAVIPSLITCMHYPSQDYIRYYGVDYDYVYGSNKNIYYQNHYRVTSRDDKYFQFTIGTKNV